MEQTEKLVSSNGEFFIVEHQIVVPPGKTPERIDTFLARHLRNVSRTKVSKAIENHDVLVNGKPVKANHKVKPNDIIVCKLKRLPPLKLIPENIPLEIVYEDDFLMVVNKPAGMVTHPGYGNRTGTLVNAVLYHLGYREEIELSGDELEEIDDSLDEGEIFASQVIRPGIVHRLDKNTTGLLLVSKDPNIHQQLAEQFSQRTVERYYYALVWGEFDYDEGTFEGDIGRSPRDRKLFAVVRKDGKPAITDFWVVERFEYLTLVKIKLRTGRTHQIRVHFSHNKHPVFGDPSYGGDRIVYGGHNVRFKQFVAELLKTINRQMLHAKTLGFYHPILKKKVHFEADFPKDFKFVLDKLKEQSNQKTIQNLKH
ncbi:MAG: RluA family pseudouridine synthase [Candidatus Kapaibacteriota bacterium]|jgi:23S rRNA pseudouridine1911/1915/1917 synthase